MKAQSLKIPLIIYLLMLVQAINFIDFMLISPLGPFLAASLHIDPSHIGLLTGSYVLAGAVVGILIAPKLDHFDRRHVLLLLLAGLMVSTFLTTSSHNMLTLMIFRVIAGCFGGPMMAISFAIVSDVVPAERRGQAIATIMAAISISSVLGVPFGLLLADLMGWKFPFYSTALICLLLLYASYKTLPPMREHLAGEQRSGFGLLDAWHNKRALLAYGSQALSNGALLMLVPNIAIYIVLNLSFPKQYLSALYIIAGIFSFIAMRLAGKLMDKGYAYHILIVAAVLWCVPVILIYNNALEQLWRGNLWLLLISACLLMPSATARGVVIGTLSSMVPEAHQRAGYMSLQSACVNLAMAFGSMLGTVILTTKNNKILHMTDLSIINIIMAMIAFCLIIKLYRLLLADGKLAKKPKPLGL